MSSYKVTYPEVKQADGSLKGEQTFHSTLADAVAWIDRDTAPSGGVIFDIRPRRVTDSEIAASRAALAARKKATP